MASPIVNGLFNSNLTKRIERRGDVHVKRHSGALKNLTKRIESHLIRLIMAFTMFARISQRELKGNHLVGLYAPPLLGESHKEN